MIGAYRRRDGQPWSHAVNRPADQRGGPRSAITHPSCRGTCGGVRYDDAQEGGSGPQAAAGTLRRYPVDVDYRTVIVGGGISGLAAAFELRRRRPDWSLLVLERGATPGGWVRSSSHDGFRFDWGPNGFQPAPRTMELVEQLGLTGSLVPASESSRARYLYRDWGLRKVPLKPQQLLGSGLLSPAGKLRLLLEPLLAGRPSVEPGEESVFEFVRRHFGREVAALSEPMVMGITAGDAHRLSLDALFPALRRLESEHGSLLRAVAGRKRGPRGPALYSLEPEGMGTLTTTLASRLGSSVHLGEPVSGLVRREQGGFELRLEGGESVGAERVVLAVPAYEAARLLAPVSPAAAAQLAAITYADVSVLALGYHRVDVPRILEGFGFLVPRGEGVRSLGVLWTSSLFPNRAPERKVLLRVIAGGPLDPRFNGLDDRDALAAVRRDLRVTMGITAEPVLARRLAFPRAIPQYELGHRSRVVAAMKATHDLAAAPGRLVLAGNAYHGVAVNDCIRDADRVVDELLAEADGA